MTDTWPALYLAGLGAFHGLNPAMGWLFAVALGLHRQSRTAVMASLVPIVIGHAVSIAVVAGVLVLAGTLVPHDLVRLGAGAFLLAWAAYYWRFGHRHRVRFSMLTGFGGLVAWSFLMATAHGAGVMLWPALMPACLAGGAAGAILAAPVAATLAGIGIHTVAMAATAALVAVLVYDWLGVAVLRRAWLNADRLWMWALVGTGALLLSGAIA
jgi:hypothetical protein